jgi:uncharacterized damage-inducible protein DinB
MRAFAYALAAALCAVPAVAAAQNPVSDALRSREQANARRLTAALETFPADKFGYKPTPEQMTVAAIAVHLAEGNDELCSTVSGTAAPQRAKVGADAGKEQLMARLRETFEYCNTAFSGLTDAQLGDSVPLFGGPRKATRAFMAFITSDDWADHYSQLSNYLRLNGMVPPSARPRPNM